MPAVATRQLERRIIPTQVERRDEGGAVVLCGYAATFNQPYNVGPFWEQCRPGCFTRSLKELRPDVYGLYNHESSKPLSCVSMGGLSVNEDAKGLFVRCTPTPTSFSADLIVNVTAKVVRSMSFGFTVLEDSFETWQEGGETRTLRTLIEVELPEVSFVVFPANEMAQAWIDRSRFDEWVEKRSAEAALAAQQQKSAARKRRILLPPRPAWLGR